MQHRVVIRLSADGASEWLALDRAGAVVTGPSAGLPQDAAEQVDLLLPAEHVLLLSAPRLAKRASQLTQALPYAIEDQLAGAVELQHVAFKDRPQATEVPVAVVARQRLRQALEQLAAVGLSADRCRSVAQLLPVEAGQLSVLVDGAEAVLRWGESATMSCHTDELGDSIRLLQESVDGVERIRIWRSQRSPPVHLQGLRVEELSIASALPWLAARFAALDGPDLLQGDFQPQRSRGRVSGQWRLAAGLAAAAVLASFLTTGVERWALERHSDRQRTAMENLLREALPGTQRIVDPLAQLSAELNLRRGTVVGGALPLLNRIAPLIAGSGRYTIEALDYRSGALELTISAPDVAALDSLRATLAALPPLQVELTSALPGSKGVEGRLRIREGAA